MPPPSQSIGRALLIGLLHWIWSRLVWYLQHPALPAAILPPCRLPPPTELADAETLPGNDPDDEIARETSVAYQQQLQARAELQGHHHHQHHLQQHTTTAATAAAAAAAAHLATAAAGGGAAAAGADGGTATGTRRTSHPPLSATPSVRRQSHDAVPIIDVHGAIAAVGAAAATSAATGHGGGGAGGGGGGGANGHTAAAASAASTAPVVIVGGGGGGGKAPLSPFVSSENTGHMAAVIGSPPQASGVARLAAAAAAAAGSAAATSTPQHLSAVHSRASSQRSLGSVSTRSLGAAGAAGAGGPGSGGPGAGGGGGGRSLAALSVSTLLQVGGSGGEGAGGWVWVGGRWVGGCTVKCGVWLGLLPFGWARNRHVDGRRAHSTPTQVTQPQPPHTQTFTHGAVWAGCVLLFLKKHITPTHTCVPLYAQGRYEQDFQWVWRLTGQTGSCMYMVRVWVCGCVWVGLRVGWVKGEVVGV